MIVSNTDTQYRTESLENLHLSGELAKKNMMSNFYHDAECVQKFFLNIPNFRNYWAKAFRYATLGRYQVFF